MKTKVVTFLIAISCSEFGNLAKFYKRFAKGNRIIEVESVEFEGDPDQHNTGILTDKFVFSKKPDDNYYPELQKAVENFLDKNSLHGECFSITKEGSKKVLFTEDDF